MLEVHFGLVNIALRYPERRRDLSSVDFRPYCENLKWAATVKRSRNDFYQLSISEGSTNEDNHLGLLHRCFQILIASREGLSLRIL